MGRVIRPGSDPYSHDNLLIFPKESDSQSIDEKNYLLKIKWPGVASYLK